MASWRDRLSPLQVEFLTEWFKLDQAFFLTGGAVLVGFLGEPRTTRDLDLFTVDEQAFSRVQELLDSTSARIGGNWNALQTSPDFRRVQIVRGEESVVVDLVHDKVPQHIAEKRTVDGIRVDPDEELLVNKICTLVSRGEPRDFIDVAFLVHRGLDPAGAIAGANRKDAGVSGETLLLTLTSLPLDQLSLKGASDDLVKSAREFLGGWAERIGLTLHPRPE